MNGSAGRRRAAPVPAVAALLLGLLVAASVLVPGPTAGPAPLVGSQLQLADDVTGPGAPLVMGTVPPVPGFPVTVDGTTVLTDTAGEARFDAPLDSGEALQDRVTLTEATLDVDGQQVLVRADRVYPSQSRPLLALDLSYQASFDFVGSDGAPVAASAVERLVVKSETGEVVDVPPGQPVWLTGSRVIKRSSMMEVKRLTWSVQRVQFAGSNVVNASQQRFLPAEQQQVSVRLLFFSLRLRVVDAMYGTSHTGSVELVYPDGRVTRHDLDEDGRLSLTALPRGDYTLTVLAAGPRMSRPLAVSRDQSVDLDFYGWWDVGTVLGVLLGVLVGLACAGRVRRRPDLLPGRPPVRSWRWPTRRGAGDADGPSVAGGSRRVGEVSATSGRSRL